MQGLGGLRGGNSPPLKMVLPPLSFSQFSQFMYFSSNLCSPTLPPPLYFSKHWFAPLKFFIKKMQMQLPLQKLITEKFSPNGIYLIFCVPFPFCPPLLPEWHPGESVDPLLFWLYVVQVGFYMHCAYASVFIETVRKDFVVIMLHHVLTISLLLYSYSVR